MKLELNKVTWYSKLLAVVLFVLTFYIGFELGVKKGSIPETEAPRQESVTENLTPVRIKEIEISEENFSGKTINIEGTGLLVLSAQSYVDNTLKEFKDQADRDVPEMKERFGNDNPSANYNLTIGAKYLNNSKTESVVISVYSYTGGAHGSSYYKVFTSSKKNQKIIPIYNLVKKESVDEFVLAVKKEIYAWRPEKETDSPVFGDVVEVLKLDDFSDWSMDDRYLTIYFSQYAIGPGVLGQVEIQIPIEKVGGFLSEVI